MSAVSGKEQIKLYTTTLIISLTLPQGQGALGYIFNTFVASSKQIFNFSNLPVPI